MDKNNYYYDRVLLSLGLCVAGITNTLCNVPPFFFFLGVTYFKKKEKNVKEKNQRQNLRYVKPLLIC